MNSLDFLTETSIRHQQAATQAHLERQLLVREALADRRVRFYQPMLVNVGRQMVAWGIQLQRRYEDLNTISGQPSRLAAQPK
jgi:hypothetical protein